MVPVRGRDDVYRLVRDKSAWNMDGSVDARPRFGGSWIRYWEIKTGKNARRCSFVSCSSGAEDGGHIWIAGGNGAYIAPICKRCNWCENVNRMQGSGSQLRSGTEVVLGIYTNGMHRADRRIAIPERKCRNCGVDISNQQPHHRKCYDCFQTVKGVVRNPERACGNCGVDISNQPPHHRKCSGCWNRGGRGGRRRT